jgi:hypothetical protein
LAKLNWNLKDKNIPGCNLCRSGLWGTEQFGTQWRVDLDGEIAEKSLPGEQWRWRFFKLLWNSSSVWIHWKLSIGKIQVYDCFLPSFVNESVQGGSKIETPRLRVSIFHSHWCYKFDNSLKFLPLYSL